MLHYLPSFWYQTQIFEKKIHFPPLLPSLSRKPLEAHHSPPLTIFAAAYVESFCQACAPGTKGRRDDVILTGLDKESDSTNEEMPPLELLEPLEGAAQLGEVSTWGCSTGHRYLSSCPHC